jgi:hypothetical protein
LVAPGDPSALAAAELDVVARHAEMGQPAREHARRFGTHSFVERVEELIAA